MCLPREASAKRRDDTLPEGQKKTMLPAAWRLAQSRERGGHGGGQCRGGGHFRGELTQLGEPIGEQGRGQQNPELPGTEGRPCRRKSPRGRQAEDPDGIEAGTNSEVLFFVSVNSLREPLAVEAKRKKNRTRG